MVLPFKAIQPAPRFHSTSTPVSGLPIARRVASRRQNYTKSGKPPTAFRLGGGSRSAPCDPRDPSGPVANIAPGRRKNCYGERRKFCYALEPKRSKFCYAFLID